MSRKKILIGLLIGALFIHVGKLLIDAGVFYASADIPLNCQTIKGVPGAEDFAYSKQLKKIFVSSDTRLNGGGLSHFNGAIYLYDLVENKLENVTDGLKFEFHPHGIGLWEEGNEIFLYVVSHRKEESVVEVFKWINQQLSYVKTIKDEKIVTPNDIHPVGIDKFYLSLDHGSKNPVIMKLETYTRLGQGKVLLYSSHKFSEVASSINFANGLAADNKRSIIYLASMLGKKIYAYQMNEDLSLEEIKTIPLDVAPDNLTIDTEGNLLIGAHAKLFDLQSHMLDHEKKSSFEVVKIKDPLGNAKMNTVMANDGTLASGVSVAMEIGDEILLGTIYQDHLLRCKN